MNVVRVNAGGSVADHADPAAGGSLANLVAQIGQTAVAVIELPGNTAYRIGQDLTIPANIDLKFLLGAVMTVSKGVTLSIDGAIDAGLRQIFAGKGI
jgi:hypothetical protein